MASRSVGVKDLFTAQRIAVVGASPKNQMSRRVLANLRLLGFPDSRILLVNPNYASIDTRPCYPALSKLPAQADVAVILTPKHTVVNVLRDALAAGIKAAVVIASGFAESGADGAELQREMADVGARGLALCGPNTMGLTSLASGFALFTGEIPGNVSAGALSAVFQSGGMLNVFLQLCAYRRIGVNRFVVTGNEAGATLADYLEYYAGDPATRIIAVHVESVRNGAGFRHALQLCRKNNKPVVALLVGKSSRARQTVQAHSGNLVANSRWKEALKGYGVIVVDTLDEMLNTANLLSQSDLEMVLKGIQLATVSGGDCSWLSDLADRARLELPDLPERIRDTLRPILRKESFIDNPLDVGGLPRSGDDRFERTMETVCQSPDFSLIALRLNYPSPCTEAAAMPYRIAAETARRHGKQPVFLTRASEALGDDWMELFAKLKVPLLLEYGNSLRAIRMVQDYWSERVIAGRRREVAVNAPALHWLSSHRGTLTYVEATELARHYEIALLQYMTVNSSMEAVAAAHVFGLPVALKVDCREIAHKTEAGGVALNLDTEEKLKRAYDRVVHSMQEKTSAPFALIVQPMVPNGIEMLLGVVNDPDVGPLVVVASGGIFTEVFGDAAIRPAPVSREEAYQMIMSLRGRDLLLGARGRSEADIDELAAVVERISLLARDCAGRLKELDFNPVIVLPKGQGVKVVDALVVLAD
jgi:acyl-CoA synthetase (NDP forming)